MGFVRHVFVSIFPIFLLGILGDVNSAAAQTIARGQAILARGFAAAEASYDFAEQLRIVEGMLALIRDNPNDRPVVQEDELLLLREELKRAVEFQGENLEVAKRIGELHKEAGQHFNRHEKEEAIEDYREALRLSYEVYGPKSVHSLGLSTDLALTLVLTDSDLNEAEALLLKVLEILREKDRTNSYTQLSSLLALTSLSIKREDLENASKTGLECSTLMESWGTEATAQYLRLHVCMAEFMNQQKRHETALEHAIKCLDTRFIPFGNDIQYYIRGLREYTFAKVKLDNYDKVPEAFEEMLKTLDRTPGYPVHLHLQYLREYRSVLVSLNKPERIGEIDEKILRLEEKERLSKS